MKKLFILLFSFSLIFLNGCNNEQEIISDENNLSEVDNIFPEIEGSIPKDQDVIINQNDIIEEI